MNIKKNKTAFLIIIITFIITAVFTNSAFVSYSHNKNSTLNTSKYHQLNTIPLETAALNQNKYIIRLNKNASIDYINKVILKNQGKVIKKVARNNTYQIKINKPNKRSLLKSLKNNSLINYLEADSKVYVQKIPSDPAYSKQWNLALLELDKTWEQIKDSRDITVAVLDTGILPDHPDLKDNIVDGYDFIDNDSDPTDTDPDFSHGTHVAGIIGAVTDNDTGIAGINWNIRIMPIRVIGSGGSGGYSTLISGINWAVDNGADIINLSLAGPVNSHSLKESINYAVENGVTVVAAAGNNGSTPLLYPARYPEVISVGAVGPTKKKAFYSNYGPNLDLVAPGGDDSITEKEHPTILSTAGQYSQDGVSHQYTWAQGTSMAAPHVSGLIALLYSSGIKDPLDIQELLKNTADDLGPAGIDDNYGAGLININRALAEIAKQDN